MELTGYARGVQEFPKSVRWVRVGVSGCAGHYARVYPDQKEDEVWGDAIAEEVERG